MSQKVPIGASLGRVARQRALDHIQNTGKALPATVKKVKGAIVSLNLEVSGGYTLPEITIPHFGPEYTRYPTQKGDKGVVIATDAMIGHMSGLGPKKSPGLSRPGNLSPLIFLPIGNADWSKVDPDKMTNYGKGGAVLRDKDGKAVFDADASRGAGFGFGKPSGYNEENIDPGEYDHHVTGGEDGVRAKSKKKVTVDGKEKVDVKSETEVNLDAPQTNVPQNLSVGQNLNVGQTLQAALAAFGGIGGIGGGAVPGNLNMGGNIGAGGNVGAAGDLSGRMVMTAGFTIGAGPNQLPAPSAALRGARCYVTDADAPAFLQPLVGGGTAFSPAICTGTAWVAG
ncbi:MAG: hypothetical protein N2444_00025 [Methylocystis sp.]|nr:hypothetical protein [Methylocystis sp.]